MKVAVVIPAYNEARDDSRCGEPRARPAQGRNRGGRRLGRRHRGGSRRPPRSSLISNAVNLGKGASLWRGFAAAIAAGADAVVTIDADGQHCPEDIPPAGGRGRAPWAHRHRRAALGQGQGPGAALLRQPLRQLLGGLGGGRAGRRQPVRLPALPGGGPQARQRVPRPGGALRLRKRDADRSRPRRACAPSQCRSRRFTRQRPRQPLPLGGRHRAHRAHDRVEAVYPGFDLPALVRSLSLAKT